MNKQKLEGKDLQQQYNTSRMGSISPWQLYGLSQIQKLGSIGEGNL